MELGIVLSITRVIPFNPCNNAVSRVLLPYFRDEEV